jgi:protocatechuate 3,4-dioxygenase beta subunit
MNDKAHAPGPVDAGTQPPYLYAPYVSTRLRAPTRPLLPLPEDAMTTVGPLFGPHAVQRRDSDLTLGGAAPPIGERLIVCGSVRDDRGRPLPGALVELWQANAAGRYRHARDDHDAPLDPNFTGCGRALTDSAGQYRFVTIRPGAYPWRNHPNAWRPAHIHFSLFGAGLLSRLVTQMYFPGDPLLPLDPVFMSTADARARERLIAHFDPHATVEAYALAFRFDIVLRGAQATPFEGA